MKKKMIFAAIAAAVAISGYLGHSTMKESQVHNALALANVEALTQDTETHNYEKRNETKMEIWDDTQKIYHSLTVIECDGKGDLVCP